MAHGNFDDPLVIVGGKVFATGPLTVEQGEEIVEIYSWVVQDFDGAGSLARCDGESEDGHGFMPNIVGGVHEKDAVGRLKGRWEANPTSDPAAFTPGKALAMALAIGKRGDKVWTRYWWEQPVTLVDQSPGAQS
jgi:hypothetical protein